MRASIIDTVCINTGIYEENKQVWLPLCSSVCGEGVFVCMPELRRERKVIQSGIAAALVYSSCEFPAQKAARKEV